ncbi:MAG: tetratricopeptide repeat protein [Thaumarchaeota archaeon]|nr:MAG: tetratricopeptide repeat protein [Nitrososphaerota archaeon]
MYEAERRLAAIMFTDIVGYAALTQSNEAVTLDLLENKRRLLRPVFASHGGREVKTIGDAFLVEFGSALDATLCAIAIQTMMNDRRLARGEKLMLRIGIHLGDVIASENDVLGDAVNIASRIEPLSEPGGVCISQQVYDQVHNKIPYRLVKLERRELKNLENPPDTYKVVLPWESEILTTEGRLDTHRVAILPLVSMSADPQDEFFADGLTEELIDRLSQVRELEVIARTSVMVYKKKEKKAAEIGRELKAGALVEGSVRKAGNRIRVTAQLIDANTEGHLWSSRYDKDLQDVFAVQSDIAEQVAEALRVRLLPNEKKAIEKKTTESSEAYTLYLKGRFYWNERTRNGTDKAVTYFEEAVKLDPRFALAYAGLADCYVIYEDYGWLRPREANPKAKEYAMKALEIDPGLAEGHATLGMLYNYYEWRWDEAEKEFKRAIELKPSYATAYQWYSIFLRFMLRSNEAYEQIKRAFALDPLSRVIWSNIGEDLLVIGKVTEAIEQLEKLIEAYPDYSYAHVNLGFAYYLDSRTAKAIDELRKALELSGGDPLVKAAFAYLLGLAGRRDEANEIIEDLKKLSTTTYVDYSRMAVALFAIGSADEAFSYLEKAYQERSSQISEIRIFPWFSEFRKDPRWASLEKRMGLRKE